jgi:uncharacterized protein (UPF0276 family)
MPNSENTNRLTYLGFGLGLRPDHYEIILETQPPLDWFEILTENYLVPGGKPLYFLDLIRANYPLVMHGVSLSIGSSDPIDMNYLKEVKALADRVQPAWMSDHLCWTGVNGLNMHDLLPLPYTEATIAHVVSHITQVQEYLGRQILIENVSSYLTYTQSEMTEWEFLAEIAKRADCYILLDVNNIYVSSFNHDFDPHEYLRGMPKNRIQQIHLAGHSNHGDYIIDTHDAPVIPAVWDLYADTIKHFGLVSTMIERDDNIPELPELLEEVDHARRIVNDILEEKKEAACLI